MGVNQCKGLLSYCIYVKTSTVESEWYISMSCDASVQYWPVLNAEASRGECIFAVLNCVCIDDINVILCHLMCTTRL